MADMSKESLERAAMAAHIPSHMVEGLVAYILDGRPTGSFLFAILSNDLRGACNRADDQNKVLIWWYVFFLYNNAPMICWGSEKSVRDWVKLRGYNGYVKKVEAANEAAQKLVERIQ